MGSFFFLLKISVLAFALRRRSIVSFDPLKQAICSGVSLSLFSCRLILMK